MFSKYLPLSFFLTFLSTQVYAQNSGAEAGLMNLTSHHQFFHSKGYVARAGTIQAFLSEAIAFYQSEYPEIFQEITVLILDKNDWATKYQSIPYGIPFFDHQKSIVIPADKFTASMELGYEDLSTDQEISEFDKYILTTLGHSYIVKNRKLQVPEVWMRDLLATFLAVSFFEVNDFVLDLPLGKSGEIMQKSLRAYSVSHQDLSAGNYYWYQAKFVELSGMLFNKGGFQLLTELFNHFEQKGSIEEGEQIIRKYAEKEYELWKAEMK